MEVLRGVVAVSGASGVMQMIKRGEGISLADGRVVSLDADAQMALDAAFKRLTESEADPSEVTESFVRRFPARRRMRTAELRRESGNVQHDPRHLLSTEL